MLGWRLGMPRRAPELTEKALAKAVREAMSAGEKRLIAVGGVPGLHLQVRQTGHSWILRYQAGLTAQGRPWRRDMGLGAYPEVSLAEARERAREVRRAQREGIDPIDQRRAAQPRQKPVGAMTFDEAARR